MHRPAAPALTVELNVNGAFRRLELDVRTTLLDALRERLGLGGTKGCAHGQCGACTVLLDGRRVASCLTLAVQAHGRQVTTIEDVARSFRLTLPCPGAARDVDTRGDHRGVAAATGKS